MTISMLSVLTRSGPPDVGAAWWAGAVCHHCPSPPLVLVLRPRRTFALSTTSLECLSTARCVAPQTKHKCERPEPQGPSTAQRPVLRFQFEQRGFRSSRLEDLDLRRSFPPPFFF